MKQIFIVGKTYKNQTGGPANIIRGLSSALKKKNVDLQELCLNETFGKGKLFKSLFKILFTKRNCIVNVHTDGLKLPKLVYAFSRIDKKNRYFLTVHGLYYIESKMNGTYMKKYANIEKSLIKKFPNLICVSELLKKRIETDFNRTKNITVIPNGIDIVDDEVSHKQKLDCNSPLKLLMLGGIRERKGIFECVEAVEYLLSNGINVELSVYGVIDNQEINKEFHDKINQSGLGNNIFYKGNLTDKNALYRAIRESDIQLCLSKWDTFNVAIIESLALGVPCIASNQCGASSAITEGVNGIVVNLESVNLREAIQAYCVHFINYQDQERELIIHSAFDIRKSFSWSQIAEEYLEKLQYN